MRHWPLQFTRLCRSSLNFLQPLTSVASLSSPAKMSGLEGKFKLTSSENFGDFLKEIGVSMVTRKLAEQSKPTVEILKDGDYYVVKTYAFKTSEIRFKLGEEFEEKRLDGVTVKTVITLEDGKLVQKQFGEKECTITREVEGNTLTVVCTAGNVVSTRIYKRE